MAAAPSSGSEDASPAAAGPQLPARLWVGNVQPRVAEYQLLQLARPLGAITRFDFLLHQTGPLAGKPRGYAFISYSSYEEAAHARARLDGTVLAGGRLAVRWAHEEVPLASAASAAAAAAALSLEASARPQVSAQTKIRAIEAKLMNMDRRGEQLVIGNSSADVKRLPKVKGPLQIVNSVPKVRHVPAKPYARK